MIISNLEKPLTLHKNNLQNNNIYLYANQIKLMQQKLKEEKYPSNNKANLQNLAFYFKNVNFINPDKKCEFEKYNIYK